MTHSGWPQFVSMVKPMREVNRSPLRLTTGTLMKSASHVVVPPLQGKGSNAMSMLWYKLYCLFLARSERITRDIGMPFFSKRAAIPCRVCSVSTSTASMSSLDVGTIFNTLAQSCRVKSVSLAILLHVPNVTYPAAKAGVGRTSSSPVNKRSGKLMDGRYAQNIPGIRISVSELSRSDPRGWTYSSTIR